MNIPYSITKKSIIYCYLFFGSFVVCNAQQNPKEWAMNNYKQYLQEAKSVTDLKKEKDIENFRQNFAKHGYRKHQNDKCNLNWQESLKRLSSDGRFSDLIDEENKYLTHENLASNKYDSRFKSRIEKIAPQIWLRLSIMADAVQTGKAGKDIIYNQAFQKAIIHYGNMELERSNYAPRFHESCFMIPTAAMNIYYAFLGRMDEIESGNTNVTELEKQTCIMLKELALQAWTQPIRNDKTDKDVSSIDRFRHHVWWVGGNGLAYRSLLPVACMIKSIPMVDVLSVVSHNGISCTSQTTNETSFWSEGFTADGAGWGHGRQCLIWGYPIDGTASALNLMSSLRGSSWEKKLDTGNKAAILNYLRGSNWYYYKGYTLPCLGRGSFAYTNKAETMKSKLLVNTIMNDWKDSFTPKEMKELKQFESEMKSNEIIMNGYKNGEYNGTRYFFNNDDLIKKNKDYHVIINMASVRCDGIESAPNMADGYNFTSCDGMTLFQRNGHEYMNMYGAFDVLQAPGITARLGEDELKPITNWRGYCSKYNFAGAATNGGDNAVAGYLFEKMNASDKEGVNDTIGRKKINNVLYGIKAHKSYFWFGDYMLALGAGVTNLTPNIEGDIQTTIEQTSKESDIYLLKNNKKSLITGKGNISSKSIKDMEWIVQDGKFAYSVMPSYTKSAFYKIENRKADWVKKNITNKKIKNLPQNVDVLQIGINHGANPVDDKYGYVVYAGKNTPSSVLPFNVLRNDTLVQAASSTDKNTIEIVFYKANEKLIVDNKTTISASQPCIVLMEKNGLKWNVSITDPTMNNKLNDIALTINGKSNSIKLPHGELCGKPSNTIL